MNLTGHPSKGIECTQLFDGEVTALDGLPYDTKVEFRVCEKYGEALVIWQDDENCRTVITGDALQAVIDHLRGK